MHQQVELRRAHVKRVGEDTTDAAMFDVEMVEGSRQKPRGARWIAEEVRII
jgi:hypothetical protein